MQQQNLFKEPPLALPLPMEKIVFPRQKRLKIQSVFRFLCLSVALSVLSLCAYEKLNSIFENGLVAHVQNVLFSTSTTENLSDKISKVAFGETKVDLQNFENLNIEMPKIFYIPKEELIKKIEKDQHETETKLADLYNYDLSAVPSGFHPIIPTDSSTMEALALKNDTSFSPDISRAASFDEDALPISNEPLVLIVHTHGTESFSSETPYYSDNFNHPRSVDVSENIVAVGKVLCDELNKKGIPTVHCETMHDKDSYISAYEHSAESIKQYLEKYPSIKYVFDVHRDSMIRSDLAKLRPVTLHGGKPCAQIMIIIGSSEKGSGEYPWEKNLGLAAKIQTELFNKNNGLVRKLYLRGASYNQQYSSRGLLLEIGSCGNTLAEAKEAAIAFADAFEKVIKK